jgi:uncharacterized membrane protein YcaP (DUF421 family)
VINEGFIILTMFLFFEFNHMQSVGYMNWVNFVIFGLMFLTKMNSRRLNKDLLAVDYVLISILLPCQIIGRIIGSSLNQKSSYMLNFIAVIILLCFLIFKLFMRCIKMWKEESESMSHK